MHLRLPSFIRAKRLDINKKERKREEQLRQEQQAKNKEDGYANNDHSNNDNDDGPPRSERDFFRFDEMNSIMEFVWARGTMGSRYERARDKGKK